MSRSDFEAYKQAKDQIAHLEAEMAEFQASSRELERELEMELEESEERHKSLQNTINVLNHELDEYKTKHRLLQKEFAALQASLQREIVTLQTAHKEAYSRLREIEMANDDMERMERITQSTLEDIEQKYHDSLEQIAMLEAELSSRDDIQIELQRTKDELRDANEELSVAQHRIEVLTSSSSTSNINNKENRHYPHELSRRPSRLNGLPSSHDKRSTSNSGHTLQQHRHLVDGDTKMNSSRSLRKIHGMLDQMKNLESRVATFKSSLPKPVSSSIKLSTPTATSNNQSSPPRPRPSSRLSNKGDTLQDGGSHIPISRFRNSPSMSNLKASINMDTHSDNRPMSPPPRTRSSVSNYSSHYSHSHHHTDMKKLSDLDEKSANLKRHESNKFGGSYQGSTSGGTRSTSLHGKTHTVDLSSFNSLSISNSPIKMRQPTPFSSENIKNYKHRARGEPISDERSQRNPYPTDKRPGSAFGSMHSRDAIRNSRS